MKDELIKPNYIFEVSWEVCNIVGGIHTAISTKAIKVQKDYGDRYILLGPDVYRDSGEHPEFTEDYNLLSGWKQKALEDGIRVRIGRWKISGTPLVILVDFTPFFVKKDEVFSRFWETYKLDSISGQWDYIEPSLFGYACGMVIAHYVKHNLSSYDKYIAQFHEWMTGAGLLYLKKELPQIGTVFTTHGTVLGRSVAEKQFPLYSVMNEFKADVKASEFHLSSKHSMEKICAQNADVFTTVSNLTSNECRIFLDKDVDLITPNGFDDSLVPSGNDYDEKRTAARNRLIKVASCLLNEDLPDNTFLIAHSGRYEFKNAGIDLFIDAIGKLSNDKEIKGPVIAFILLPANHYGPRKDLVEKLGGNDLALTGNKYLTHNLHYPEHDPILNRIADNNITNNPEDKVKIIFSPSYLGGNDGIFNTSYYDLLIGFDLTVYPSYYEPWGYTPLESLAFRIPTITTSLAGFGLWVRDQYKDPDHGIFVIERNDFNDEEVVNEIARTITTFRDLNENEILGAREVAYDVSQITLWSRLFDYYQQAYHKALSKVSKRVDRFVETERVEQLPVVEYIHETLPNWKKVVVVQYLPKSLRPLEELSKNLWWCWNQDAIDIFETIDPDLWKKCEQNPIVLIDNIPYKRLTRLEKDIEFINKLNKVYIRFKSYMDELPKEGPQVAYFSMEFGLHDSLKIYSGGLGLLAGDYLKEASDYNYKIIGIGLLYKYGYFKQVLSAAGEQLNVYESQHFSKIPVSPVRDMNGNWVSINIAFPGRELHARIWEVKVGRVKLYLLDTDLEENAETDRGISHQLYGGDNENRFKQELLLGIGGIRALRAMGYNPDIYHCNEGHAAFIGLERLREYIQYNNHTFPEAMEIVRSSTLFTTHTPVPAGHDYFDEDLMRAYIAHYPDRLNISWNQLMDMGKMHPGKSGERFSMSCLAVNLSQEINGVSRLHGKVSRQMFADMWKGYMFEEVPIGHVTNGVHIPTWISKEWRELYHRELDPDFYNKQEDREMWAKIKDVDQLEIWKIRNSERKKLIEFIKERLAESSAKSHESPKVIREIQEKLDPNALTIVFARRFATYKRAHLLFRDTERLASIVNNPFMPVQFFFAGKAHPKDKAGQDLIKLIVELSRRKEFLGKIIFLENYEICLAKKLIRGADIWLNTPTRPLEASGTSGEKAVMNGLIHFSVLDGWWAEGYVPGAGYALQEDKIYEDQNFQDILDAENIYSLLEDEITPTFYKRDARGVPVAWVDMIQKSISSVAPEFTMNRMLRDYIRRYYEPLYERSIKMKENEYEMAAVISSWKKKILNAWNSIEVISVEIPDMSNPLSLGKNYLGKVILDLKTLNPEEIGVELLIGSQNSTPNKMYLVHKQDFKFEKSEGSNAIYRIEITPTQAGMFDYGIRLYPKNELLVHKQDLNIVKWI
jgi:glycogen phosphorylase/synthase